MNALPATILPHVGKLIRLMGSPIDGECLASVRALDRVLRSNGADWHTLAARIESPPVVFHEAPRAGQGQHPTKWDDSNRRAVADALRDGIQADVFTEWEHEFAASIITTLGRPRGKLSPKQIEIVDRLLLKIQEARR